MLKPLLLLFSALTLGFAGAASAQLPNVGGAVGGLGEQVGGTVGNITGRVGETVTGVQDRVEETGNRTVRELRRARAERLDLLRRQYPDLIDVDGNGDLVARSEVLAIAPSSAALDAARARGFSVSERAEEGTLGLSIVMLRAPAGMSTRRAVETLREIDPEGAYEFNHLYSGAGEARSSPRPARQSSGGAASGVRIGLIDSGADADHPALRGLHIQQRSFARAQPIADSHGTAVASLLAGEASDFRGAAPGASLFVADVYGGLPNGGGAASIVRALNWMARERVAVVNVSLVGPPNRALESAISAMVARGHVIVAAVGNDGPSAPPLYPAAYSGVVGVTGVDARNRPLPEAGRGPHVDFAAPGSDMAAASVTGGYGRVRGTSYAAPIVAGLIALQLNSPDPARSAQVQSALSRQAQDLGARGPDRVFGAGLVGGNVRVSPQMIAGR